MTDLAGLSDEQLQTLMGSAPAEAPSSASALTDEQLQLLMAHAPPPTTAKPSGPPGAMGWLKGAGETALQLGTGLVAQPIAGLAGLAALPKYGAGAGDVVNSVQSALTYQPKTRAGQTISQVSGYIPQKFKELADAAGGGITDLTGSPLAGAAVNTAIQGAPLALGARFMPARAAEAATVPANVAAAGKLGLSLTPEQAGGSLTARSIQSLTNSAKLERKMSLKNAPVVNSIAKDELGVPQNVPLSAESIAKANEPANAIYQAVGRTGRVTTDDTYRTAVNKIQDQTGAQDFPSDPTVQNLKDQYSKIEDFDASNAVNHVKQLRQTARANMKNSLEPERNAIGRAQLQIANAIEDQLDRHIQAGAFEGPSGQIAPDLMSQFRGARVQLAKAHTIEDALDGQNLSAKSLADQLERGAPLSGRLRTVAESARDFDRSFQDVSKIRNSGPFSNIDSFLGAASLWHPSVLGAVLAPPLARAALASQRYQRRGIQGLTPRPSFPGLMGASPTFPLLTAGQRQGLLTNEQQ